MYFVAKATLLKAKEDEPMTGMTIGRCRRHSPTMSGWPVMFESDWCGDHKMDEEKI